MAALGAARCFWRSCSRFNGAQRSRRVSLSGGVRTVCTGAPDTANGKPAFSDGAVQDLLRSITGLDLLKVFSPRQQKLTPPTYKLMTDQQLEQALCAARDEAMQLLQMPPVLQEREPVHDVLSRDQILSNMDSSKYVFTDISFNVPHRERFIVVRETDGTLRKASWDERDRLIQTYFPRDGRKIMAPALFQEENLQLVFSQDRHKDVLDLCLVQFEPDSSEYIKIHASTYEDLDKRSKYDLLRSTRHFGGLAWFLVGARTIDGLLLDMIHRKLLNDAVSLVTLFHLVHPHSDSAQEAACQQATGAQLLKVFSQHESQRSGSLELALQALEQVTGEGAAA